MPGITVSRDELLRGAEAAYNHLRGDPATNYGRDLFRRRFRDLHPDWEESRSNHVFIGMWIEHMTVALEAMGIGVTEIKSG